MRIIVFVLSLVIAVVLVMSGQQWTRGTPGASTFAALSLAKGLGWLACMVALLALLGYRPAGDTHAPGLHWITEGLRDRAPLLAMVGCAALILHMLIGSVSSGSIASLMRYPVKWNTHPAAFTIHFILWASLGGLLGWRLPRKMLRKYQQAEKDEWAD
ncbi:MAG: hypothetical protein EOO27_34120 [Comamonadaceae bacterium]|nr:MAG: hypothetical protein EOO27_34120 [Comamonadaceae bacterium]